MGKVIIAFISVFKEVRWKTLTIDTTQLLTLQTIFSALHITAARREPLALNGNSYRTE